MKEYSFIKFIPNSITLMSLIAGLSSIKFSIQGNWELSVLMIMLAAFFDFFDGWMARKLKKSSQFGAELDSLSDFISFGLAPALLINLSITYQLGRLGWIFSLFFIVCAALRLARFNIENMREQSKTFFGIPSPAAAGVIMIPFYINFINFDFLSIDEIYLSSSLVVYAGIMMISRVPTPSAKNIILSPLYMRLITILVIVILIFLITYFWQTTLFLAVTYLFLSLVNLFFYFTRFFRANS